MSKQTRFNTPTVTGKLETEEVPSFTIWEVFTQKKEGDAHIHAGSLSAPNVSLASQFAREHYGQDQVCVNMWIWLRDDFGSDSMEQDSYELFVQWNAGDRHVSVGSVPSGSVQEAKEKCVDQFTGDKSYYTIWAIPSKQLTVIDSAKDMIWRSTDQSYRLARGYSKIVREKWDKLRAANEVDKYQEEDLKETF